MRYETVPDLEAALATPTDTTQRLLNECPGDCMVLGAGGKMGPTLAMMLRRAAGTKRVFAVSRFSDRAVRDRLERAGVETLDRDLMDRGACTALPRVPNVFFLAGMKFGATGNEPLVWAMNTYVPALVAEHFSASRIVALSTGNIYPFVPVSSGGSVESTRPEPIGEYAQSCLGRERTFEFFSHKTGLRVVLIRLNYANEPRYGIIVDLTQKILRGQPVDLSTGYVNLIWQGDANNYIAQAITLPQSPAAILNVTGPETVCIRQLCLQIGNRLNIEPKFTGEPAATALLSNAGECIRRFGPPTVTLDAMVETITDWVASGKDTLGKPTKFQVRNGKF